MKLWCRLEDQLGASPRVGNNSKFNHRSTEKSLSNFAMSQLLEVYVYFPNKNYNGWFTWKSPSKWKGNSSDPNIYFFFLGKKALSFRCETTEFIPAFQRSQERKPWKNAKEPRETGWASNEEGRSGLFLMSRKCSIQYCTGWWGKSLMELKLHQFSQSDN